MAALVMNGRSMAGTPTFSSTPNAAIQRDGDGKADPIKPDNYDEAAKKIADALQETAIGKQLKAKAEELGKEFLASVEGKVVAGTALGGALAVIVATNSELPVQIPEIPLDFIKPGLKAKLTYDGPVRSPTNVGLTLTSKGGISVSASYTQTAATREKLAEEKAGLTLTIPLGGSPAKPKSQGSDNDKYRAGTARMAADQRKFQEGLKTPAQQARDQADDQAFMHAYLRSLRHNQLDLRKQDELMLMREATTHSADAGIAPPLVHEALAAGGQVLDPDTRTFMEERFGHDFSSVRVHSDQLAARSADDVAANAYTVGSHIVFGAGRFDPGSATGSRLLAHELTHVVQQGDAGQLSLHRDAKKDKVKDDAAKQQPVPVTPDAATAYFHIVVRDSGLDLGGGVLVSDLAAAKTRLMQRRVDKPWTLVLAIHASENRLGAQAPPDWQKNAVFYDEAAIKSLFGGDSAFVGWRDQYGPNRVVLYGCQVTAAFEQTIADNLARSGKAPTARGLGEGCKPRSTSVSFGVDSRRQYDALADDEKQKMLGEVQATNATWGYYGGPPVPRDQVIDYLFKGPKPGWWPKVEVMLKQGGKDVSANPPIPYWNRSSNSIFLRQCTGAVGNLREHVPQAPTMREGE